MQNHKHKGVRRKVTNLVADVAICAKVTGMFAAGAAVASVPDMVSNGWNLTEDKWPMSVRGAGV